MTPGADSEPGVPTPETPRRSRAWRVGAPIAFALCGALFIVSAANSDGTDLRPGRYTDLASLVSAEAAEVQRLQDQVAALNAEVEGLADDVNTRDVRRLQRRAQEREPQAGLTPVTGPGVTVTLSDAPEEVINSSTENLELMVVHQQDIQAVVNAMWRGGATAVTVQGQRIITTTGIKCEGNAVQLDGLPYAQPYVIAAVGDQAALLEAINNDDYLALYREQAAQPSIAVGWQVETPPIYTAPAYQRLPNPTYATVSEG